VARELAIELGDEAGCRANEIGTQLSALRDPGGEFDEDIVGGHFAALLIRRWPSYASLPPICASTS
jgi:hypothetical protein